MAGSLSEVARLGEVVSASLDRMKSERARAVQRARERLMAELARPTRPPRRRLERRVAAGLAGLALAAVAALWVMARPPRPLAFSVDGSAGVLQAWIAAPEMRALSLRFADGTALSVQPGARARVVDVDHRGAQVALERGEIHADVIPRPQGNWSIIAGPFAVHVTGTRFDVRWDPDSEQFTLAVTEGSVKVSGAVAGNDRPVWAGEMLLVSVPLARLEVLQLGQLAEAGTNAVALVPDSGADTTAPPSSAAPSASPSAWAALPSTRTDALARDAAPDGWQKLARAGRLREAFASAEATGFPNLVETATSAELLLLGDAARLAGRPDRASTALLALRRRFPQDPRRAAAAFALGKVAFDQRHAYAQAAEWFSTCIREQPNGSLAREASGRLLEALRNAGDSQGARQAARQYLSRYPDGPLADTARSMLR